MKAPLFDESTVTQSSYDIDATSAVAVGCCAAVLLFFLFAIKQARNNQRALVLRGDGALVNTHSLIASSEADATQEDDYAILGVSRDATLEEIGSVYRRLARGLHSDNNPDGVEEFVRITKAYKRLEVRLRSGMLYADSIESNQQLQYGDLKKAYSQRNLRI